MTENRKYKDQFKRWHPGQFMAFDLIDECFEKNAVAARVKARKAQFTVDCFLVNMMIDEVCGKPKNTKEEK